MIHVRAYLVKAALTWNQKDRPDPDLPRQLRAKHMNTNKATEDPNFEEHLPQMLKAGMFERTDPELPSALRLMKMKTGSGVKKVAAAQFRQTPENAALAEEVDIPIFIIQRHKD